MKGYNGSPQHQSCIINEDEASLLALDTSKGRAQAVVMLLLAKKRRRIYTAAATSYKLNVHRRRRSAVMEYGELRRSVDVVV